MDKRQPPTQAEMQASLAKARDTALAVLTERAKTDPKAKAALSKLAKQGYAPDA